MQLESNLQTVKLYNRQHINTTIFQYISRLYQFPSFLREFTPQMIHHSWTVLRIAKPVPMKSSVYSHHVPVRTSFPSIFFSIYLSPPLSTSSRYIIINAYYQSAKSTSALFFVHFKIHFKDSIEILSVLPSLSTYNFIHLRSLLPGQFSRLSSAMFYMQLFN